MTGNDVSLLDDILPHYDVSAVYSIKVKSNPERIFNILSEGIPSGAITKLLMLLRGVPRLLQRNASPAPQDAFYKLKQLKDREIVIGIVGQFWKPVSNPVPIHSLEEFLKFQKNGYCKAALNLRILPQKPGECLVTTETRVLGYGSAKEQFRQYWQIIGPFSGVIRKEILRKIRKKAES